MPDRFRIIHPDWRYVSRFQVGLPRTVTATTQQLSFDSTTGTEGESVITELTVFSLTPMVALPIFPMPPWIPAQVSIRFLTISGSFRATLYEVGAGRKDHVRWR